ncbi:cytochrome oxidase small assembly protein [uncultured Aquabacterium sp.]|nr:cytochrome oxidase small assembly protein [uncultured Aquabacterium sp.]
MPIPADSRAANRRLGWILASVAAAFFIGFVVKIILLSPR